MPALHANAGDRADGIWPGERRLPRPGSAVHSRRSSGFPLAVAQDILNRGDYGRAAQMFKEIGQKFPKSGYQEDLPYWEAFARYKIGTTGELQAGAKLLEPRASKLIGTTTPSSGSNTVYVMNGGRRGTGDGDVVGLYIRVNTALAQRGDAAPQRSSQGAQAGTNTCDSDEMQVRVEAMGALSQMDAAHRAANHQARARQEGRVHRRASKARRFILGRRETLTQLRCSRRRRRAIRQRRSGPKRSAGSQAQGDAGVNMLEEILRTEQDEQIQRSVVRTLTSSDNPQAPARACAR